MNYSEMKELLEYYVDDTVDSPIAIRLFNEGKNQMAAAVHARFPDIEETSSAGDRFVFDERFHELPVLYAAAMVKAYDSSIREKEAFMADFQSRMRDFVENYNPPIQFVDADYVQHFKVTAPDGEYQFKVTASNFNTFGNVDVYVNSQLVAHRRNGTEIYADNAVPLDSIVSVTWDPDIYGDVQPWVKAW